MNKFHLFVFLMMKESGARLISGLVEKGFSFQPNFPDGKLYSALETSASVALAAIISHETMDRKEVEKNIINLMREREIPHYGLILISFEESNCFISSGHLPKPKKKETQSGPGKVIPFPGSNHPKKT